MGGIQLTTLHKPLFFLVLSARISIILAVSAVGQAQMSTSSVASINNLKNAAYCADSSVSANTITCSTSVGFTGYAAGQAVDVLLANSITAATVININGLGNKAVTYNGATVLISGLMVAGGTYRLQYDGTRFVLQGSAASSVTCPAGAAGQIQFYVSSGVCGASVNLIWVNSAISVPGTPTVAPQGTGGVATWEYVVRACTALSCTDGSATGTTAVGNATLSVSNFNRLTVAAVVGAATYAWYRVTSATSPTTTGFIGVSSSPTLDDTGLSGDGGSPNADEPQTGLGSSGLVHFGVSEYSLLPAVQDQSKGVLLVTNSSLQSGIIVESQGGASGGRGVYAVASSAFNNTGFQAVEGDAYIGGNGQTAYAGAFDCLAFNSATTTGTCFGIEGFGIISTGSLDLIAGVHAFVLDVGGTVTDLVGVEVETVSGGTNNYGVRSHVNAAANQWAFYGAGTAANKLGSTVFGSLVAYANAAEVFCSDCTVTSGIDNTCAGSGSGAFAERINGAWKCTI